MKARPAARRRVQRRLIALLKAELALVEQLDQRRRVRGLQVDSNLFVLHAYGALIPEPTTSEQAIPQALRSYCLRLFHRLS